MNTNIITLVGTTRETILLTLHDKRFQNVIILTCKDNTDKDMVCVHNGLPNEILVYPCMKTFWRKSGNSILPLNRNDFGAFPILPDEQMPKKNYKKLILIFSSN